MKPKDERRAVLIALYGGKCKRCGFDDIRALQIDHVYSDGYKSMSEWKWLLWDLYRYPDRFQCLCANCNWIKRDENNEHPGSKPNERKLEKRDWLDNWIASEGLRPAHVKEERRNVRLKFKDVQARAKELRRQDKEQERYERAMRRHARELERATLIASRQAIKDAKMAADACASVPKPPEATLTGTAQEFMRCQRRRLGCFVNP